MRLTGLIAATFTPMHADGSLDLAQVPALTDYVIEAGNSALYVCGSTGEGPSLTSDERRAVAEAYVSAAAGRVPVLVQVGHNSLREGAALAAHAAEIGADAISACPPSYFKVGNIEQLVACLQELTASAPDLPFYYYHIPRLSSANLDMEALLEVAADALPNLVGIKYSAFDLDGYQRCIAAAGGRYDILFGADEMLLSGLAVGGRGAVGSTYNFAAPLYRQVIDAFDAGDLAKAAAAQLRAAEMVKIILAHGGQPAIKAAMNILGASCGPTRLPLQTLSAPQLDALRADLAAAEFIAG
jgi:N-acetylneuraminate lyase